MNPITYVSEQPEDFARALDRCKKLEDLLVVTAAYESIAPDARALSLRMDEADFRRFKRGLHCERKGEFAGEVWMNDFGSLLLPEIMFKVSIVASKFGAPWGCAYLRLKEMGKLPTPTDCHGVCLDTKGKS